MSSPIILAAQSRMRGKSPATPCASAWPRTPAGARPSSSAMPTGSSTGVALVCTAGGDTRYYLYEHGRTKEQAVLYANGTCEYDGETCRADYAPFVQLQAKVLPIKARPPLVPPHSRLSLCRIFYPAITPSQSIGHWFGTRRSWR